MMGAFLRRWRVAFALLGAVLLVTVAATPAKAARLTPLDVVVALDDSGSQFGEQGTDPAGLRYEAARFAGRFLSSISTTGLDNRIGLVRFGTDAPDDASVPLQALPGQLRNYESALDRPRRLGATNFAAAFRRAAQLFGPPQTGRKRVLLVFTDGVPSLDRSTSQDKLFADIERARQALPGVEIDLFGVDRTGRFDDLAPRWRALGLEQVQRLGSVSPDVLARAFATLLSGDLGLTRRGSVTLNDQRRSFSVDVGPYQEALVVTHFAVDPAARVEVVGPDGERAGTSTAGRAGLLRIRDPAPGRWTLRLSNGGSATVTVDQVPIEARLVDPIGTRMPVGRPLFVEASFRTSDGRTLPELPDFPRYFGATVLGPGGEANPVELMPLGSGLYRASEGIPIRVPGGYRVALSVRGAERETLPGDVRGVSADDGLYFVSRTTDVASRKPLRVQFTLERDGRAVDASEAVADDPNSIGVARLTAVDGRLLETVRIRHERGADFIANFKTEPADGATLTVSTSLRARDRNGRPQSDDYTTVVSAEPSTWTQIRDVAVIVLGTIAGVLLVAALALAGWWRTRPITRATVRIDGEVCRLQNVRHQTLGPAGVGKRKTWVWGDGGSAVRYRSGRLPLPFGSKRARRTSSER